MVPKINQTEGEICFLNGFVEKHTISTTPDDSTWLEKTFMKIINWVLTMIEPIAEFILKIILELLGLILKEITKLSGKLKSVIDYIDSTYYLFEYTLCFIIMNIKLTNISLFLVVLIVISFNGIERNGERLYNILAEIFS